ncbi:MAG: cell division protein FtsZ [Armatimonadota bacterium]
MPRRLLCLDTVSMSPVNLFESVATIKVIGVGGGGCNAVNRMIDAGVEGVEFVAMNTDRQALQASKASHRLALGTMLNRGMGTGGDPSKGEAAARDSEKEITAILEGCDMVFITAGMGGGTGTGGAHVVAELARRLGVLTVGVVTKPFTFEGGRRGKVASQAIVELEEKVDTLVVLPNDRMTSTFDRSVALADAFQIADDVLRQGVQGISDIVNRPGMINVDFADVRSVLSNAGRALMGIGVGKGDRRARQAAESAANSPMLEAPIVGARKLLVNFTAGSNFSIGEVQEAMEYLNQLADPDEAEIFMGHVLDESMGDMLSITLIAAGGGEGKRPADTLVFKRPEPIQIPYARAIVEPQQARPETGGRTTPAPTEAEVEDLVIDIPAFLRQHRERQQ